MATVELKSPFIGLPEEVTLRILRHSVNRVNRVNGSPSYDLKSFAQISKVCSEWHRLVRDRKLAAVPRVLKIGENLSFFQFLPVNLYIRLKFQDPL